MDINGALNWGRGELGAARGTCTWRDAEILMEAAAGRKRYELFLHGAGTLDEDAFEKYRGFIYKRREHVPVAYIVGSSEFMSLPLRADGRALIPRPETEVLTGRALEVLDENSRVFDVGTGSGNIAVSAAYYARCRVCASDISCKALALAGENAAVNGVAPFIEFFEGDMFEPLRERGLKGFDMVISNPPYVKTGDIKNLQSDIRLYEPRIALDGGLDGLDFYRKFAEEAPGFLKEGGVVLLETGFGQGEAAAAILGERGFSARLFKDYSGVYRFIEGTKVG